MPKETEKICFDCNQFFPEQLGETSEFGICLMDPVFEPYLDELLEGRVDTRLREIINSKKYEGDREICEAFQPIEEIEDPILTRELADWMAGKKSDQELREILRQYEIRNQSIEKETSLLKSLNFQVRQQALSSLCGLMSLGHQQARLLLLDFFRELPPPASLSEVHFKIDLWNRIHPFYGREELIPILIQELDRMPSNQTTRGWWTAIFRFFRACPVEKIREPLQELLHQRKFSARIKKRLNDILCPSGNYFY